MTVLVTGAAGFVGSRVVRCLVDSGAQVTALVRPGAPRPRLDAVTGKIEVLEADLDDTDAIAARLADTQPEACIHAAWYAVPGDYLTSPQNLNSLRSSLSLLEALAGAGCKHIVGVGSCFEYNFGPAPLKEDSPAGPATLYAACKVAYSLVAAKRCAQLGMDMAWARLFYLYGPGEDDRRLVPAAIKALTAGQEFPATSGEQVRDYLHIDDVASGLCALSQGRLSGTFNVCSGEPVTIARLVRVLGELLGRPDLIRLGYYPYRQGDPMYVCGDNHRLLTETRWLQRLTLREGLADTIEWWKGAQ